MPTNLAIDDALLNDALRLGKHKSKREAVNAALTEYIKAIRRRELVSLFGTIDYHPGFPKREKPAKRRRSA